MDFSWRFGISWYVLNVYRANSYLLFVGNSEYILRVTICLSFPLKSRNISKKYQAGGRWWRFKKPGVGADSQG